MILCFALSLRYDFLSAVLGSGSYRFGTFSLEEMLELNGRKKTVTEKLCTKHMFGKVLFAVSQNWNLSSKSYGTAADRWHRLEPNLLASKFSVSLEFRYPARSEL